MTDKPTDKATEEFGDIVVSEAEAKARKGKHVHRDFNNPEYIALMVASLATTNEPGLGGEINPTKAATQFANLTKKHGKDVTTGLRISGQMQFAALVNMVNAVADFLETSIVINEELKAADLAAAPQK